MLCAALSRRSRSFDRSVKLGYGKGCFSEEQGTELSRMDEYRHGSTAVRKSAAAVLLEHALLEPYSASIAIPYGATEMSVVIAVVVRLINIMPVRDQSISVMPR